VVTSGQFTFNIQEMVGKVGNGATAVQTYRVFVGEVTVSGNVTTAIVWYALMGRYQSAATLMSVATTYNFNHNLGVPPQQTRMSAWIKDVANGVTMPFYTDSNLDQSAVYNNHSGSVSSTERISSYIRTAATAMMNYVNSAGATVAVTAANGASMTASFMRNW